MVCRNVLIYFEPPLAAQVIESLQRSLRPGGLLVLGAADALMRITPRRPFRRLPRPEPSSRGGREDGTAARPGAERALSREQRLAAALDAADKSDRGDALAQVASLLADNPLDADAHFVRGLVTLEAGEPEQAVAGAPPGMYADPTSSLAAFTLGRAHDALGDGPAARRAYERVLRTINPEDHRHELILQQVDIGDIAAACRARLGAPP